MISTNQYKRYDGDERMLPVEKAKIENLIRKGISGIDEYKEDWVETNYELDFCGYFLSSTYFWRTGTYRTTLKIKDINKSKTFHREDAKEIFLLIKNIIKENKANSNQAILEYLQKDTSLD